MKDPLDIDRESKVAQAFRDLLKERGYPSINEYMLDVLREEASKKREARLRNIGQRMFPDGAPTDRGDP